jgi:hypothetical protein
MSQTAATKQNATNRAFIRELAGCRLSAVHSSETAQVIHMAENTANAIQWAAENGYTVKCILK